MSKIKVLFRQDFDEEWEHMIVYKDGILISDSLENHRLSGKDVLEELANHGLIELEVEDIIE